MKKIYRFEWVGQHGTISGIFAADSEAVKKAVGYRGVFGSILGKDSNIDYPIEDNDIKEVTDDQQFVEAFEKYGCATGYNPLEFLRDYDDNRVDLEHIP